MPVRAVDDKPSDTLVVFSGEGFWTGSSTLPHLHHSLGGRVGALALGGGARLDEPLDECERQVGDVAPAVVDRQRVAAARDLADLGDAGVPRPLLVRGVGD